MRAKQGKPLPWVQTRLVDDDGLEVPWDGESTGELEVRGPWIAASYFDDESGADRFHDGWLRTGDIASIDEHAFIQITDRSKDVIKSGGEWISSVELENEVMAHPDVIEAAVIAKPDERWAERPLCCVVVREGAQLAAEELLEHLRGRAWPSGGCPTSSLSSPRSPRPASASSTRRSCAPTCGKGRCKGASRSVLEASNLRAMCRRHGYEAESCPVDCLYRQSDWQGRAAQQIGSSDHGSGRLQHAKRFDGL